MSENDAASNSDKSEIAKATYSRILPYFLGPTNENYEQFQKLINQIVTTHLDVRDRHAECDGSTVTAEGTDYVPRDSSIGGDLNLSEFLSGPLAESNHQRLEGYLRLLGRDLLGQFSIPFWNPKYSAHMCMDTSMPGTLGYIASMMYNANNVAVEASPITTVLELEAGKQLCGLIGFGADAKPETPAPWGHASLHVTSGGTVANIESLWAARNLKFYPLSLRNAMRKGEPLHHIENLLEVPVEHTATRFGSGSRRFSSLSGWELVNLRVDYVLSLPQLLYTQFGISPSYLQAAMEKHGVQTVGMRKLEEQYGIKRGKVLVSSTNHYSWPKACALTGIGRDNLICVKVNEAAQLDNRSLLDTLRNLAEQEIPVFAVVAIVGSTEEGAVDDVDGMVELREVVGKRWGLHFCLHVDAAWGGYFATLMKEPKKARDGIPDSLLRYTGLRENVNRSFLAIRHADSCTVDPHKSGYVPYPAGALCYRNGDMRYLVTFSSPYIARVNEPESVGVYGIEGSKAGACAAAVWMSNSVIGLGKAGNLGKHGGQNDYRTLLGTTMYSSSIYSAYWATLPESAQDNPPPIGSGNNKIMVVPFNKLAEVEDVYTGDQLEEKLTEFRQRILDTIIGKSSAEIAADDEASNTLYNLGSDLTINCFVVNFKLNSGEWNSNVEWANTLNKLIVKRMSSVYPSQQPDKIKFFVTSTEFHGNVYGECAAKFKERLRLKGNTDLFVLRNVVMSPLVARNNFIQRLIKDFNTIAEEEADRCIQWADPKRKSRHYFLLQTKNNCSGGFEAYLVYLPNFYMANSSRQLILKVGSGNGHLAKKQPTLFRTSDEINLEEVLSSSRSLELQAFHGTTDPDSDEHDLSLSDIEDVTQLPDSAFYPTHITVNVTGTLRNQPISTDFRDSVYPEFMPFYAYGDLKNLHLSHILLKASNTFVAVSNAKLEVTSTELEPKEIQKQLSRGAIIITKLPEAPCQPFDIDYLKRVLVTGGGSLEVELYQDELLVDDGPVPTPKSSGQQTPAPAPTSCSAPEQSNKLPTEVLTRTWPHEDSLMDYITPPGRRPLCTGRLRIKSVDDLFFDDAWLNDDMASAWRFHDPDGDGPREEWKWERIGKAKGKLSEWESYVDAKVRGLEQQLDQGNMKVKADGGKWWAKDE
ncbi:PLP-dependent transferase [Ascobolus immersus RN42]|uniref:PLP-dependent transferase n=1 Tax=Ascobolus immersus RN42 TaxID=1160509 RepID=A0A3N4IJV7_ASCIM|nr:PLP-dependent transferase [Ascobolus immersus RN42]